MVEPRQVINTLRDVEGVLQRLPTVVSSTMNQAEQSIVGAEHGLEQCRVDLENRLSQAQASLTSCLNSGYTDEDGHYHAPNCSSEERAVYEVQNALSELRNLSSLLADTVRSYRSQSSNLQSILDGKISAATYYLRGRQDALEQFERSGSLGTSAGSSRRSSGGSGGGSGGLSGLIGGSSRASGDSGGGSGGSSYSRINHGIVDVPVSELPDPDLRGEEDFSKVSASEMRAGLHKLQEIRSSRGQGKGLDGDYWSQVDSQRGLSHQNGYRRIYDAFYGDSAIRVEKVNGKYDIINGRHRVWLAKRMGITHLPVDLIELNK